MIRTILIPGDHERGSGESGDKASLLLARKTFLFSASAPQGPLQVGSRGFENAFFRCDPFAKDSVVAEEEEEEGSVRRLIRVWNGRERTEEKRVQQA